MKNPIFHRSTTIGVASSLVRRCAWALAFALGVGTACLAHAAFPEKPLRILLPVPPGGATDAFARSLAARLQERMGQPVLVESKAGANGILAADALAKSAPDGHTLLLTGNALAVNASLYRKLPYDTVRDLKPVALLTEPGATVLVAHPRLNLRTLADLRRMAQARPGMVSYGSAGQGSPHHLPGAMLEQKAGIQLLHVPYKGAAQALTDLLGGQIDLMFNNLLPIKDYIDQGRLVALAQTGKRRMASLPDVPTFQEAGVAGYEFYSWFALFTHAATPKPVLAQLQQAVAWALAQSDVRERLLAMGTSAATVEQQEMGIFFTSELRQYSQLLKDLNLTLDTP